MLKGQHLGIRIVGIDGGEQRVFWVLREQPLHASGCQREIVLRYVAAGAGAAVAALECCLEELLTGQRSHLTRAAAAAQSGEDDNAGGKANGPRDHHPLPRRAGRPVA